MSARSERRNTYHFEHALQHTASRLVRCRRNSCNLVDVGELRGRLRVRLKREELDEAVGFDFLTFRTEISVGLEAPVKRTAIKKTVSQERVWQGKGFAYPTIQSWRPCTYLATISSTSGPQDGSFFLFSQKVSIVWEHRSPT